MEWNDDYRGYMRLVLVGFHKIVFYIDLIIEEIKEKSDPILTGPPKGTHLEPLFFQKL